MNWMFLPYKRYFDFEGRSTRREYWLFMLLQFVVLFAVAFASTWMRDATGGYAPGPGGYYSDVDPFAPGAPVSAGETMLMGIFGLYWLTIIIPSIAVTIRRLHDSDRSGLNYLWIFLPLIGGLIVLVFTLLPGTEGENRFGPDPRDPEDLAELEATF